MRIYSDWSFTRIMASIYPLLADLHCSRTLTAGELPKEAVLKKTNNIEICFEEEDFDGFLKKLKTYPDAEHLGDVIEHSWGQRVIRFYDPDGHLIEVGESMKMVITRFLDSGLTME